MSQEYRSTPIQLIDMVFLGDANHHGTLFGGVALAHMDKVAFLAASRHGRAAFVTASSEKIDFAAPAKIRDMVEVTGRVVGGPEIARRRGRTDRGGIGIGPTTAMYPWSVHARCRRKRRPSAPQLVRRFREMRRSRCEWST